MKRNKIKLVDDYAVIVVESKRYGIIEFKIDKEDLEKVQLHCWYAGYCVNNKSFYAKAYIYGEEEKTYLILHRFLMNTPKGLHVDHLSMDTLDNRKSNLKNCTHFENMQNRRPNSSGRVGVYLHKHSKRWQAEIYIGNKRNHLGYFDTFEEAVQARIEAEELYYNYKAA